MARRTARKSAAKAKRKGKRKTRAAANRLIGVLHTGLKDNFRDLIESMKRAAEQESNQTVDIHGGGHYANDDGKLLDDYADELVNNSGVEVIVAAGGPQSALAAMDATNEAEPPRSNVAIVFTTVADPEGLGLVDSTDTPGENITGMAGKTSESDPVRLQMLHALVARHRPNARKVGVLINPGRQGYQKHYRPLRKMANDLRLRLVPRRARNAAGIARAFQEFRSPAFLGVVVTADAFFNNSRATIIAEAKMRGGIPTIYQWRSFVEDGGLISYGPSIQFAYTEAGRYVGRILSGENPATMRCSTPGPFELVVNTTTAARLNIPLPDPRELLGKKIIEFP